MTTSCDDDAPTVALMAFDADLTTPEHFYDAPFPSDFRLDAQGRPDLRGFAPMPATANAKGFLEVASQRRGFALAPVAYVRFSAPLAPQARTDVIAANADSPIVLVDIDPDSPERGTLRPLIAETLVADDYTAENILAVAPYPGFLLREQTTYAVIVTTQVRDASGNKVGASSVLREAAAQSMAGYELLWPAADALGLAVSDLAAAMIFTTGDPFGETLALSEAALANYAVSIDPSTIALTTDPAHVSDDLCELTGTITYPQFQSGDTPYNKDGLFVIDENGVPVKQRDEVAAIGFAIPKTLMPADGYPLAVVIHGTTGFSNSFVAPGGDQAWGNGIGIPFAKVGIASAGSAMPINDERVPSGPDTQYANLNNLPVARFNLTQGILETRMFVRALGELRIPVSALNGCVPPELLGDLTEIKFDAGKLMLTGQSMGGMYASMVAATEPLIKAVVPTGAGGYFSWQFLINSVTGDPKPLIAALLHTAPELLSQLHPALMITELAFEPADPLVFVSRVVARPAPGHEPIHVLQTTAPADEYFPPPIYAGLATAYGHPRLGDSVMPEIAASLALAERPVAAYPLSGNVNGKTAAVVEYEVPAGHTSGHGIITYRDDTRYQVTCFFKTFVETGVARLVAPQTFTDQFPCE
ncbi:MAG: hypothetical protein IPL79_10910 [Myxococcales bacterium]|nr:hypothetical protein [Myxococcales bacterium]